MRRGAGPNGCRCARRHRRRGSACLLRSSMRCGQRPVIRTLAARHSAGLKLPIDFLRVVEELSRADGSGRMVCDGAGIVQPAGGQPERDRGAQEFPLIARLSQARLIQKEGRASSMAAIVSVVAGATAAGWAAASVWTGGNCVVQDEAGPGARQRASPMVTSISPLDAESGPKKPLSRGLQFNPQGPCFQ